MMLCTNMVRLLGFVELRNFESIRFMINYCVDKNCKVEQTLDLLIKFFV